MPDYTYQNGGMRPQNVSAYEVEAYVDAVEKVEYESAMMSQVGDELFGADDMDLGNMDLRQKRDIYGHTGLVGMADIFDDGKLRRDYSQATYYKGNMSISGIASMGKTFSYPIEETEMFRPAQFRQALGLAGDLPKLLLEAEEWHDIDFFNNAESDTGGWFGTPLIVDGSGGAATKLQLLGRPNYFDGYVNANLVDFVGGPIPAAKYADAYFDMFINEEARPEQKYTVMALTGEQYGRDLVEYYNSKYDMEAMIPWLPNRRNNDTQRRVVPKVVTSNKLDNPTDIYFFGNGWADQIKKYVYFQNKQDNWETGAGRGPQWKAKVFQVRTFKAHYFKSNRLILKVKGAAVN